MCGRFLVLSDEDNTEILEIMKSIDKKYSGRKTFAAGEIFPGTDIPVLTRPAGGSGQYDIPISAKSADDIGLGINNATATSAAHIINGSPYTKTQPGRSNSPANNTISQPIRSSSPTNSSLYDPNLAHWGFPLPGKSRSSQIINARSETLTEKPMFRNLVDTQRCLIPANGFFEWAQLQDTTSSPPSTGKKSKFLIKPSGIYGSKGNSFFYMAGLINRLRVADDTFTDCVVIITTSASTQMSKIHNRMPVMFDQSMADYWLSAETGFKKISADGLMEPWAGNLDIDKVA